MCRFRLVIRLKATAATFSLLIALCACSPRVIYVPVETRDSTRVEVRERIIHDSVEVTVPEIVERAVVRDTSSHLENEWCESDAVVDSLGYLHHSQRLKPRAYKAHVEVAVSDTTTTRTIEKTITVEKNVLTKSQERWIGFGKIAVGVIVGLLLTIIAYAVLKILKYI